MLLSNIMCRICSVVVRSTADQDVPGSNPILANSEFLWAQEINLRGSGCELVTWELGGVSASLIFLGAVY